MPKTQKQDRAAAFSHLRQQYGFSEYALHEFAKQANCAWIADHIDAVTAQTLATRARPGRSIGFASGKPKRCASRARDAASILSRASGTIPGCALSSNLPKRGIKGGWCGARTVCPPSSTGMTRWSN